MNGKFIILLCTMAVWFGSCASDSRIEIVDPNKPHLEIMFSFNTASYKKFIKTAYPQIAVWVTEAGRKYVKTVYVTEKGATESWWFADKRPSALPVWSGVKNDEGALKIDSVSGATPAGNTFKITWPVPDNLKGKKIKVYIEANISFDYNDYYGKDAKKGDKGFSDVNGQPSMIWAADVSLSGDGSEAIPAIVGHGQVLGENSFIDKELSTITTAKDLFYYIKTVYREGKEK